MAGESTLLCERPEVFRLVNLFVMLVDHSGKRLPGVLIDPKDNSVQTFRAAVATAVSELGFVAEWQDGPKGRKLLGVRFPSPESESRFREAYERTSQEAA